MNLPFVLSDAPRVRYFTGSAMYFAQGVPAGLISIALPAWLVSQGVSAGEIASFFAVVALPWALKLLAGPLMDRFQFLAMGTRRPWVLGAQLGLTIALLSLVLVDSPVEQMSTLMALGVLINIFTATQDVAVDGMSIDLTPLDQQGRLNAFMAFGKAMGWSISAAISGVLLVSVGLGPTAVLAAIVSGVMFVIGLLVVERRGERVLPWSKGEFRGETQADNSLFGLFRGVGRVLWTAPSMVLMAIMFFDGLAGGYGHALMPIAAVKLFGFSTPEWSQLVAMMGLMGAGVALLAGPIIDRVGAKRMLVLVSTLVVLHAFLLAETQFLWQDTLYVRTMLAVWILLGPLTMVCVLALAMALCSSASSATQFAIYMSTANLGSAVGAKIYGLIAEGTSYPAAYIILGCLSLVVLTVLFLHRHRHARDGEPRTRSAPQIPIGFGTARAGVYFSGAMRCPKCRAGMDLLDVDGVQVDRCSACHGLWFDAGEVDRLRNKAVAMAVDIGDVEAGKAHDVVDRYRCPRCGGRMVRTADRKQRHISYEQCSECEGTYFDAGEFVDLATFSVSDLFKGFVASARK